MILKEVQKLWGKEEWLVNNEMYCAKKLYLKKGFMCSYHYHKNKDETFVIESGQVCLNIEGKEQILNPKDIQRILPGQKHCFNSISNTALMLEISTHHEDSDSYRETESRKIN